AISHQPSAISHQPSAISHQPSAISHQENLKLVIPNPIYRVRNLLCYVAQKSRFLDAALLAMTSLL
ncbi:MAG TPA: hypothetical protein VN682_26720, partial [Terriglobales bacterium]|nr:hypothetical protein [Terriglobales bacterium]